MVQLSNEYLLYTAQLQSKIVASSGRVVVVVLVLLSLVSLFPADNTAISSFFNGFLYFCSQLASLLLGNRLLLSLVLFRLPLVSIASFSSWVSLGFT